MLNEAPGFWQYQEYLATMRAYRFYPMEFRPWVTWSQEIGRPYGVNPVCSYFSESKQFRVAYHPEWDSKQPWVSYLRGTAGRHFPSVQEAAKHCKDYHGETLNVKHG